MKIFQKEIWNLKKVVTIVRVGVNFQFQKI